MRSQGVAGRARRSSPTLWARRFWLPVVDRLFQGSHRPPPCADKCVTCAPLPPGASVPPLPRNRFEPSGLVATAIRVRPPHGEVIPSIETNPDLVLEALIFLHYRRSTIP